MIGMINMPSDLVPFNSFKKKKKINLKKKEEEIIYSLFEIEKFLCCCNKARKYSELAKFLKRDF